MIRKGRYIIDLEVGELILTICNIYAPNKDDPIFVQNTLEQMIMFRCEEIILGGDFNLVMDVKKDKNGREIIDAPKLLESDSKYSG